MLIRAFFAVLFITSAAFAEEIAATTEIPQEVASAIESEIPVKTVETKAPLAETDIPVQLETVKKTKEADSGASKALISLGILAMLGAGALYLIRKNGRSFKKSENTQIKVLTQHYLGPKKSLAIIRVAGESILVGITDQNINMIKSLSLLDEDIPEAVPQNFSQVMSQSTAPAQTAPVATGHDDDFSMAKIKDVVSDRLRSMRTLE